MSPRPQSMHWLAIILGAVLLMTHQVIAGEALTLERKISLGEVRGRIDHLAIDLARGRVFVAELGNGSLGVVDLRTGEVVRRIMGLAEPQGVAYDPATDTVWVATGGDGVLHRFTGADLQPLDSKAIGEDADNVRIDAAGRQVLVGYTGALCQSTRERDPGSACKRGSGAISLTQIMMRRR
jgi:DNA-binding beta-propeller fold protein YncE